MSIYSTILDKFTHLNDLSNDQIVLQNGIEYLKELLIIMDEHQMDSIDKQTALAIEEGIQAFLKSLTRINLNQLFENDSTLAKQFFYSYFDLFHLSPMKNYFQRKQIERLFNLLYTQVISILLSTMTVLILSCKFTREDLEESKNNRDIFVLMLNYMKEELDPHSSLSYSVITKLTFSFLWIYADKTVLIPNLLQVGFHQSIVQWLNHFIESDQIPDKFNFVNFTPTLGHSKIECIRPSISILHNISRHDDGIIQLNQLNTIDLIKTLQTRTKDPEIEILSCMTLALLLTAEQIKADRKQMNNALDRLLQSVFNASQNDLCKNEGFHVSESLVVLVKLFNDDRSLDYVLQHAQVKLNSSSTLLFFIQLFIDFHHNVNEHKDPLKQLTCTALANILWSISFQEHRQYRKQIKNHSELIQLLEHFAQSNPTNDQLSNEIQYIPKFLENIQTAAQGILLNINENLPTVNIPKEEKTTRPMIMISYSHDDKFFCYQLEEQLKQIDRFDIWIDKDFCTTGDSWEQIAKGIKQSQVVLCLISENYNTKSVRREVIYAIDRLEKPILPVFILRPFVPDWLEIRTCDLTHIRFTDQKSIDQSKMSKLIQTLNQLTSGTPPLLSSAPSQPNPPRISTTKTIDEWNKDDIEQWFENNGIDIQLAHLYDFNDGSELLSYARIVLHHEKSHFNDYSKEFEKRYQKTLLPHQFNKFTNSLQKLPKQTQTKSSLCILL